MTNPSSERQFREDLPRALVLLRESRGLSQKELADRLGVHASVLSRYETGVRTPATVKLAELLKTLVAGWGELELALAEVRRARLEGGEPSKEALAEPEEGVLEDGLLVAFLAACHEGRGRAFANRLMERTRYIATLQRDLERHLAQRPEPEVTDEADGPGDNGDDRPANGGGEGG